MRKEEGYVKYRCIHEQAPAPEYPGLSELNRLRSDLFRIGFIGVLENGVGYGNVSLRAENGFIVTATATGHIPVLGPEGYC
ncbi:MAG: hypothetical protein ACI4P0_03950, partial [Mailhella sp.]